MTDLFDWARAARRTDPVTSWEAALRSGNLAKWHHALILTALRRSGRPMAAEEIADEEPSGQLTQVEVNRRFSELERAGLIVKTTERHRNRSGRGAFRYELARVNT